ncbi:DUF2062 domain-containing protein [Desulfonatronovibrio hydrogenovorans]|uniref:DUF2062 domain-containing protein n=1 Tax=Desulfonatronovibrio hydrogenovorans TaxID=53245 RepID=UPI001FC924BC|nr:DUF2062 domain-containing protein [Desulfonatronovibrio hydrogenovorans]
MNIPFRFSLKRFTRYWYLKLSRIRESPHSVAMGLSVGVFVGCLPIIPFQTVVALGLAFAFRCNKIAAALGTWVTNPLYAPFVYYGLYLVGKMIIPVGRKEFDPEDLTLMNIVGIGWDFFGLMLFGGIVVGLVLSMSTYLASVRIIRSYHDRRARIRREKRLKRI